MNEDMPWVNLTQEEVEELRNKKYELTEYGKQRLRELMRNQEPYPDAMFEEAERREAERKALDALDKLYEENGDAMLRLAEIEKDQWEREQRERRILERYNDFYNTECSGLTWGTPITPEFQQAMTLECMLDALRYENLNHEFSEVSTADINDLINNLYDQGKEYLKKWEEFKDSADGVA
jgi:DNA-binding PadR family transcriptional regulator